MNANNACEQMAESPLGGTVGGKGEYQFSSVAQSCLICDPMECSTPGFPVHHQLQEPTQTHVHSIGHLLLPSIYRSIGLFQ